MEAPKALIELPVAGGTVFGYGAYLLTMWIWTGNPLEGFEAQRHFPTKPSIGKIFDIAGFWAAFVSGTDLHSARESLIDRVFFVMILALLPAVWRRGASVGLCPTALAIIPASSAWFMSYSRHAAMCFPVFMTLGKALGVGDSRTAFWYVTGLFSAI